MDFDNIFNGIVTVLWSVAFIPWALRERKTKLLGVVSAAMLAALITISTFYAHHEQPWNSLVGVGVFCFGFAVGYGIYFFESKKQRD